MASSFSTQALLDAQSKAYGSAFEALDVEALLSWHSDATVFNDIALDEYNMNRSAVGALFGKVFPATQSLRILESRTSGSLTQCVWETLIEIENKVDDPTLSIVAGQKTLFRVASVLEWRWEGLGDVWDGDLSDAAVRGWKIVRENDYTNVVKAGSEGEKARMFQK